MDEIGAHTPRFLDAEIAIDRNSRACSGKIVLQRQQSLWVAQHPAPPPLTTAELDRLYSLPFSRRPHPPSLKIPAFEMIKNSVTIVRGCAGNCSFCAIARHQGPAVISRSNQSIYQECKGISQAADFGGTITDLGGPTANLFGTECSMGSCRKRDCLYPSVCPHLKIDEDLFLDLLAAISAIPQVKNLFISSGLRMGLLLRTPRLLRRIIEKHTPGSLKIAPEHTDDEILQLMHKEPHDLLKDFVRECRAILPTGRTKTLQLTPYIITAHPGSTPKHAKKLVRDMQSLGLPLRQFQDFTPTPGTLSTAMYVTGLRADSKAPLTVSRKQSERAAERRIVENYSRRYNWKRKIAKKDK
ncbi:MAG: radical SAM protein [Desulforhopalus sp.]